MIDYFFDERWFGSHGIGRFSEEIYARLSFEKTCLKGSPLDVIDPLRIGFSGKYSKDSYFFSPGFNAPCYGGLNFSFTIHDLIHLRFKSERTIPKAMYYNCLVKRAIFNSDKVFTVSEFSKKDILSWCDVSSEKIIVAGNGVGSEFNPQVSGAVREKPYILYMGNQKPHKNVPRMVRAFANSHLCKEMDLLLSGNFSEEIAALVHELRAEHCVKAAGFIPEKNLPNFYKGAVAVLMPSLYEGFGLPVVEAMSCGTPVFCSNATSLPEVGGKAALYFDPYSIESIVDILEKAGDTVLMEQCSELGLAQASLFKWDKVAGIISEAIGVEIKQ